MSDRDNLKRYYSRVVNCRVCNLDYGSDIHNKYETGICPICQVKLRSGKKNLNR
jgi:hypothetical protein